MKSLISYLFVVALCLCLSVKYASSIDCYECYSNSTESACGRRVNRTMITTCPAEKKWCAAMRLNQDKVFVIQRTCHNINTKDDNIDENDPEFKEYNMSVSICNQDLCNGAIDNLPTKLIFIISTMFFALYNFVF